MGERRGERKRGGASGTTDHQYSEDCSLILTINVRLSVSLKLESGLTWEKSKRALARPQLDQGNVSDEV